MQFDELVKGILEVDPTIEPQYRLAKKQEPRKPHIWVKGENYAYEIFGRVNDIEGKHYRCINLGMINSASGLSPETQ
jgi:hypothetical protein